ncbi:cupin domain-containing protein [Luteibaculum oceani]|uniref:Cupin domain-containing protein n=1 Tax=Luteibaculum oceani TaxID=1294296 RepID=A0A5C6V8M2_9FLAO|nr:hypothetical protein [Luteibaculum oceani]TXC81409.1 hypothetical protein FRX97_05225 [Luteibaculum oceani]
MVEYVRYQELNLGIIIRSNHKESGIRFFTKESDSQQLGYMSRPEGYEIVPHRHNLVKREVHLTQEVLLIKSGKVRVDFYCDNQQYVCSKILNAGDVVLLSDGGHGFKILEDAEIIEVKQGPYCGEEDKIRFNSISEKEIIIKDDIR